VERAREHNKFCRGLIVRMVSAKTIRYFTWATTATYYLGTFPAAWDSTKGQFVLNYGRPMRILGLSKLRISIGQILPVFYALGQSYAISFLLVVLIYFPLTVLDQFLTLFVLIGMVMSYIVQTQFLLYFEEFISCFNSFLKFEFQASK